MLLVSLMLLLPHLLLLHLEHQVLRLHQRHLPPLGIPMRLGFLQVLWNLELL